MQERTAYTRRNPEMMSTVSRSRLAVAATIPSFDIGAVTGISGTESRRIEGGTRRLNRPHFDPMLPQALPQRPF